MVVCLSVVLSSNKVDLLRYSSRFFGIHFLQSRFFMVALCNRERETIYIFMLFLYGRPM